MDKEGIGCRTTFSGNFRHDCAAVNRVIEQSQAVRLRLDCCYRDFAVFKWGGLMGMSENRLADNIQTLRDKCDDLSLDPCKNAFNDVMDFMRQDGPLQQQLIDRDMIKIDGTSLVFSNGIYPSGKAGADNLD